MLKTKVGVKIASRIAPNASDEGFEGDGYTAQLGPIDREDGR